MLIIIEPTPRYASRGNAREENRATTAITVVKTTGNMTDNDSFLTGIIWSAREKKKKRKKEQKKRCFQ